MNQLSRKDIFTAYFNCVKNKRNTIPALKFEVNLEHNLNKLYSDIVSGRYRPGKSACLIVKERSKPREIWTGCFRDKIVHHLIYLKLKERYFKHKFILNVFNGIDTRSTYLGALTAQCYAEDITDYYSKKAYCLKADISNFFNSIDKNILFEIIKRDINSPDEHWLVDLIKIVLFNNPCINPSFCPPPEIRSIIPPHKRLGALGEDKGLPVGNLVSQFFANIYLNELDQFVVKHHNFQRYCRFADDMIFFHENPKYLNFIYAEVKTFLYNTLALKPADKKKSVNLISKGFDFVGYVVKPDRIYLRTVTQNRALYKAQKWNNLPDKFSETKLIDARNFVNSYLGLARRTNNYTFRQKLCRNFSENIYLSSADDYKKNRY